MGYFPIPGRQGPKNIEYWQKTSNIRKEIQKLRKIISFLRKRHPVPHSYLQRRVLCIYIRHRALGHQWSVSKALKVCRWPFAVLTDVPFRESAPHYSKFLGIPRVPFFQCFFCIGFRTRQKSLLEPTWPHLGAKWPPKSHPGSQTTPKMKPKWHPRSNKVGPGIHLVP